MPVSDLHKVIFIHIPKNAGKSFEILLGIHQSYKGSPFSRNRINEGAKYLLNISSNSNAIRRLMGTVDKSFAAQHFTFQEILLGNWLTPLQLENYSKVAIVRDPFKRAYSLFNHTKKLINENTVEEDFFVFLNQIPSLRSSTRHAKACLFREQVSFLKDLDGNLDSVNCIRLEKFEQDFLNFCNRYNLIELKNRPLSVSMESNSNIRNIALSERNIDLIKELFSGDLKFSEG